MVDEGFCFPRLRWYTENLREWTLARLVVRVGWKTLTCVNTSFVSFPHSVSSNALSKLSIPLLPFKQLPVILSSSMVWIFCTCNFMLGPFGVFAAHIYKSS